MARKTRKIPFIQTQCSEQVESVYQAGIYARLSASSGTVPSDSIDHQHELCMEYLREQNDISVSELYADDGFSGTNFERSGFQRMIGDIQAGKINCVVVKDLSRFGRSYLEVAQYLNVRFPRWGVRFIAVLDHFDTATPQQESDLTVPFRNILNDYYAKDYAQKISSAFLAKMRSGSFVAASVLAPYGYVRDGAHCCFRVNPETAPVLQRIFQMRCEAQSMSSIAKRLNQEGIPSPRRYQYLNGMVSAQRYAQSLWGYDTIREILPTPVYLGHRIHHRERNPSTQSEEILIQNAHPPLVTQQQFDCVQEMKLRDRENCLRRKSVRQVPENDSRNGYRGLVFCAECGKPVHFVLTRRPNHWTEIYTRCQRYQRSSSACTIHSISLTKLSAAVESALMTQVKLSGINGTIGGECVQTAGYQKLSARKNEKRSLTARLSGLGEQKRQELQDYMAHRLSREEFFQRRGARQTQMRSLETQLARADDALVKQTKGIREQEKHSNALEQLLKEGHLSNELIRTFLERIDLHQNGKSVDVRVTFRFQDIASNPVRKGGESSD